MTQKTILLTGSSGTLGTAILKENEIYSVLAPSSTELDITEYDSVEKYFNMHNFSAIIHCAALARMGVCENNPSEAIRVNIGGTANLVRAALKKGVRFVQISTDGVYFCDRGNYKESDVTIPYNTYGWTKLAAEAAVRVLKDHVVIRTSFFNQENIPFPDAGVDVFSSKLPLPELASAILKLVSSSFIGIVNVGDERKSDYDRYKMYKNSIGKSTYSKIQEGLSFAYPKDSSMDVSLWRSL